MVSPIRSRRAWAGLSFAFATAAVAQESGETLTLDTVKVEAERERATDPVVGYTARRSASGTKTDTSLLETPQSISVVGREQMEAQQAQSIVEATRYTPGVRSETFGGDSRNDWFLVRGFTAQESGYYLDGLQLPAGSFATGASSRSAWSASRRCAAPRRSSSAAPTREVCSTW
ncbi:TonB-dependent receptor plug domain-containing protein [Cystobacter fuscus]